MSYVPSHEATPRSPNICWLDIETTETLARLATTGALLQPELQEERLDPTITAAYRKTLHDQVPGINDLCNVLREELAFDRNARGYVVIDGVELGDDPNNMAVPSALCALVGTPFAPASKLGFWQELGVRLDAVPYRFQGIGENPFHIDCVNTTQPPDYFCFYGFRIDPAGGGVNVLSNMQIMVDQLSPDEIDYLLEPRYTEGRFENMAGVGEEYRPFPVLTKREDGLWQVRFTAKMLPEMPESYDKELFRKVDSLLKANQERILIKPHQLLIANQMLLAHGREPLGPGQQYHAPDTRRYLRQSYIKHEPALERLV